MTHTNAAHAIHTAHTAHTNAHNTTRTYPHSGFGRVIYPLFHRFSYSGGADRPPSSTFADMYAQTPQDMARTLFEAQFAELQRARAIRKKYRTDVVLGLTSAIRVLLIDMPALYDKAKLLDYLHIVVEEARFRSSLDGVKFHAYTATLPPDRAPEQPNQPAQADQASQTAQPNQTAQPAQTTQTTVRQNNHTAERADQSKQTQSKPQHGQYEQHKQHEQSAQNAKRPKRIRKTPPFSSFEKSKYAPVFVEPHIFTVHPLLLWAQMAAYLTLEELVVLGDAMMRRNYYHVHVSPENFTTLLDELPSTFPHRRKCEAAAKLLAENTDSCMETRLRFRMHRAGYGPFVVNHRLTLNTSDGRTAFLDIAIPDLKIAIEYSGKFHANNWESDEARRTALASAGWQVLSVNAETLRDRGKFKDFLLQLSMTIARQRNILRQDV
ncbi:hypothetical protein [Bifidobacterium sp.]|uniref:hypothetical protein n=1 Tax=Bifidobacterium sp. TaxID=41200 RepID=UPI003D7DA200